MSSRDQGFTLLEVIVALAIATASMAALYQIYAVGWRGVRLAGLDRAALEVAQNQLAAAGIVTPPSEGTTSGQTPDGIAWTAEIRPYAAPDDSAAASASFEKPKAYWVTVRAVWKEGPARKERVLELETIKLTGAP